MLTSPLWPTCFVSILRSTNTLCMIPFLIAGFVSWRPISNPLNSSPIRLTPSNSDSPYPIRTYSIPFRLTLSCSDSFYLVPTHRILFPLAWSCFYSPHSFLTNSILFPLASSSSDTLHPILRYSISFQLTLLHSHSILPRSDSPLPPFQITPIPFIWHPNRLSDSSHPAFRFPLPCFDSLHTVYLRRQSHFGYVFCCTDFFVCMFVVLLIGLFVGYLVSPKYRSNSRASNLGIF